MSSSILLFIRANRRHLLELLVSSLLVNGFALALPLFSMLVYDKAVGNEVHETLWALAAGMGLLLMLEMCMRVSRVMLVEHAGARWDARLDERLIASVLAAPLSRRLPVGEVVSRYRDLGAARDFLSAQFLLPIADLPFVLVFAAALFLIGGPLVVIALLMGLLMVGATALLLSVSRERQQQAEAAHSRKLTTLVDVLMSRESLATAGASRMASQGFLLPSMEGARAGARARLWAQLVQQLLPLGMSATTVLVLVAGVYRVEAQAMSVGGLISCSMLAGRLLASLSTLAPTASRWREFVRALARLGETVDLSAGAAQGQAPDVPPGNLSPGAFAVEGLRIDGLQFAYPATQRRILDDINLHLKVGEMVAVVGASGSGKTTLLRLMAGRLAPTAGRLAFAGHVIDSDERRRWLAERVGYKAQEAGFLAGTVAQVVAPGEASPGDTDLVAALRAAGLGPALDRGELGLTTEVGTNGSSLSGGQRQMLALARVIHAKGELLLMDEPTLGLDHSAQQALLRSLDTLRQGRCLVVATHTTELIHLADRVLVLDSGRVVVDSPPERLFRNRQAAAAKANS